MSQDLDWDALCKREPPHPHTVEWSFTKDGLTARINGEPCTWEEAVEASAAMQRAQAHPWVQAELIQLKAENERLRKCLENVLTYLERHEPEHDGEKLWRRRARAALLQSPPPAAGE